MTAGVGSSRSLPRSRSVAGRGGGGPTGACGRFRTTRSGSVPQHTGACGTPASTPSSAGDAHREQLRVISLVRDRLAVPAKSLQVDGDGFGGPVAALLDGRALGDAAGQGR